MAGAVVVRGAHKRYGPSAVVLRGLDLTVPEATIYGLLGPSGCGKTTLLRAIVGTEGLDAGEIYVKAEKKNNVGYMPQELGLYDYMTIKEAFQFYGKLYNMDDDKVEARGSEMIEFLDLPEDRLIGSLSGGQQRRVSFAVALLHDPQLLILDEPTVGLDPVLSAAIWERLVDMATNERKTIILTTHYIEEARQSHTIGLMRGGVLLSEQPPAALMASQGVDSLEAAFFEFCRTQDTLKHSDSESIDISYPVTRKKATPPLIDSSPYWKTNRFVAQFKKNLTWLYRNIQATIYFILLPAAIVFLCQLLMSHNPARNQHVGIVSPELSDGSWTCVDPDRRRVGCYDSTYNQSYNRPFPCRLMDYLRNATIYPVVYASLEEGKAAVRRNDVWAVLHFGANYTDATVERMETIYSTADDALEASFVDAYVDMSNKVISTFLTREFMIEVMNMIKGSLRDCDLNPKLFEIPVQFKPALFGTNEPTFIQFFTPGVVCTFAFYLAVMYSTAAIMFEKRVGLERSLIAGMTKLELLAAHVVIQLGIAVAQEVLKIIITYYIYDNIFIGNISLVTLLLIMLQIMGMFYGIVLGLAITNEWVATFTGVGTINALIMLSGLLWPVEGMHWTLRSVVWAVPVQPAVEAYRGVAMRAWPLSHPVVYSGFLSTSLWTAVLLLATAALARSNKFSL